MSFTFTTCHRHFCSTTESNSLQQPSTEKKNREG
jgi:hypothetical protein